MKGSGTDAEVDMRWRRRVAKQSQWFPFHHASQGVGGKAEFNVENQTFEGRTRSSDELSNGRKGGSGAGFFKIGFRIEGDYLET